MPSPRPAPWGPGPHTCVRQVSHSFPLLFSSWSPCSLFPDGSLAGTAAPVSIGFHLNSTHPHVQLPFHDDIKDVALDLFI